MTGKSCNGLVVFSDLDGTLLDHRTYSHDAARPALDALKRGGHCLVLASSKTAAELASIRSALGFSDCPAIVENGAGILPADDDAAIGKGTTGDPAEHAQIRAALAALPDDLRKGFSGISDWSTGQIVEMTGLSAAEAERAAQRRFSEPGTWSGSDADFALFCRALATDGIDVQKGGRFVSLSFGATKADRMAEIVARYRQSDPGLMSVALGDAPNDIAMIEAADRGFIVRNDAHDGIGRLAGERTGKTSRTAEEGPAGWNTAVLSVLQMLNGKD